MQSLPTDVPTIENLEIIFGNLIRSSLAFAGIALFVIFLVGGFKYLTSGGDPKNVDGAQKTLTYGFYGLIAVLLSYMALVLLKTITGVDVINFRITQ